MSPLTSANFYNNRNITSIYSNRRVITSIDNRDTTSIDSNRRVIDNSDTTSIDSRNNIIIKMNNNTSSPVLSYRLYQIK